MSNLVILTDEELALLDGKCSEKVQKDVIAAKNRLAFTSRLSSVSREEAGFIADVVKTARNEGQLVYSHERIRKCRVCGKDAGYATYSRNAKYHRKGDVNYDKPLTMAGLELRKVSVRIVGRPSVGCCVDCLDKILPVLKSELKEVEAELPEILSDGPPKYKRHNVRKCSKCGWEGPENEMGQVGTLMGDGTFPGRCPKCNVSQPLLGPAVFEYTKKWVVIPVPAENP